MQSQNKQFKSRNSGKCVVLFNSTSSAIKSENAVKSAGLKVKLIPVPRQFSSDCGICLCFDPQERKRIEELLIVNSIDYRSIETL